MIPDKELDDPKVPALRTLMGGEAGELLSTILGEAGGRVRSHRIGQVRYVPGRSVTVQYRVDVVWQSGKPTREVMVATSGIDVPDGVPVFAADGVEIAVWRFPNDPFLPGLAKVNDPEGAATLLSQLGAQTDRAQVRTRAYRAGRRAVLEVSTPDAQIFIKVVRPGRAAALQQTHTALSEHVPVPHSLGWSRDQGIVALQALPGRTLRKALESRSSRLPSPAALVGLLDGFPPTDADTSPVSGPRQRVASHARLLSAVTPSLSERLNRIVERLEQDQMVGSDPVHGDFHSSQILTSGSDVVGLVDVDTAGSGDRSDDFASLLGHLGTLSLSSVARRDFDRYGAELIAEFDRLVDPIGLRLGVAGVIFGLATGPFRVQLAKWPADTERRVALAERWIDSADTLSA